MTQTVTAIIISTASTTVTVALPSLHIACPDWRPIEQTAHHATR